MRLLLPPSSANHSAQDKTSVCSREMKFHLAAGQVAVEHSRNPISSGAGRAFRHGSWRLIVGTEEFLRNLEKLFSRDTGSVLVEKRLVVLSDLTGGHRMHTVADQSGIGVSAATVLVLLSR